MSIWRFAQGFALAAVVVLALSVASGCGGSDGGASAETGSLSKTAFIAKADSVCKQTRSKFQKEFTEYLGEANPASAAEEKETLAGIVNEVLRPNFENMIEEIEGLGAPSADAQEVSGMFGALQKRLDELSGSPAQLTKTASPFAAVAKKAAAYGLKGCAESLS